MALKFACSSDWLITNFAIPAHFLAVPDWRNDTISRPGLPHHSRFVTGQMLEAPMFHLYPQTPYPLGQSH